MKNHFKNFSIVAISALFILMSCSQEESVITNGESTEMNVWDIKTKSMTLSSTLKEVNNIDDFAINHVTITQELKSLIDNENVVFDGYAIDKINAARSEEEIESILQQYGMIETDKYTYYTRLITTNYENLEKADRQFAAASETTKQTLIEDAIGTRYDLVIPVTTPVDETKRTCREQYDIDLFRCGRNFSLAMGVSVVSGWFSGGTTAVIGYAGASIYYSWCQDDARDDFNDCRGY